MAEYYPRRRDPVSGVWAHRQALAARAEDADVTVLALERPLPSAAAARQLRRRRGGPAVAELRAARAQPRRERLDGIEVEYVRFASPPRGSSYSTWHRWAQRPLARALDRLHATAPIDVVHAHYALPAGGAALAWTQRNAVPLVVSVHGGDLLSPLLLAPAARARTARVLHEARVVIANSRGMLDRAAALAGDAEHMRVIHPPGEPPPAEPPPKRARPTVVTVGAIDPRKRHTDVLEALAQLPDIGWLVIGDGPERPGLEARVTELGLSDRVEWTGALAPREAIAAVAGCHVMAMPSVDEAFGVAYAEALSCGLPAIGCSGEPGPEDLAERTAAMLLVPARDPDAVAAAIARSLDAPDLAADARTTGAALLAECGPRTLDTYRDALR